LLDGITGAAALWVEIEHYKIVGACLAAARRRANVTQQELAARLGKPQSFVSEYERGQRRVDVIELLVISRALSVDPVELFGEIARSAAFRPVALSITR
jgi:transcriptional regulator with XRE-family HTH domain